MAPLPIVARELRVAARRRGTYFTRLGAALAALGIGMWIMAVPGFGASRQIGMALFVALSVISFIYSLMAGIYATADSLSEEKREGTLGLLFLTDLKGYDVVLGKLAATSLNCFYGMLAIFPIMAISLLAGGVTGAEFWRVTLVSVNNLFFSLAVGMFCSAMCKDGRKAGLLAFLVILFFSGLVPLIGSALNRWDEPAAPFYLVSPGYSCVMAFESNFRSGRSGLGPMSYFYMSVLCVQVLAWLFLALTAAIVPRVWQDRAESAGGARFRERWLRWAHGSAATRLALRRHMLQINPFYWLAGRDRLKGVLVWGFMGFGGLLWGWGLWQHPVAWKDKVAYVWTALIVHTAFKFWMAGEASRRFAADRRSGALELMLSTPLSVAEILAGQTRALVRQFAVPALVVLLVDFVFLHTDSKDGEWSCFWCVSMLVFVADLVTLAWVGMWTGVASRHANRAAGSALVRVLVLPWLIFGVSMTMIALSPGRAGWGFKFVAVFWGVVALVNDAVVGVLASRKLLDNFRAVATQRYDVRGKGWNRSGL
jgi:ABC-type transport system involved in cytochrome c biogenesis permease component